MFFGSSMLSEYHIYITLLSHCPLRQKGEAGLFGHKVHVEH
jgi:hypothetical protein